MNIEIFREDIHRIAHQFDKLSLKEIDNVKLMDRIDTKYIIPLPLLPLVLEELSAYYKILEIDGERINTYHTLYYDTIDYQLYKQHQTGRVKRFKVRLRTYVKSGLSFFEIKQKNAKGRTLKTRIKPSDKTSNELSETEAEFVEKQTPLKSKDLIESIWVNYRRITLANLNSGERITVDLDLTFQKNNTQKSFPKIAILEIKQDKFTHSPIVYTLKKYRIRSGFISKYCLGIISLNLTLKHNRFKPKLIHLNKIIKQYDTFTSPKRTDLSVV